MTRASEMIPLSRVSSPALGHSTSYLASRIDGPAGRAPARSRLKLLSPAVIDVVHRLNPDKLLEIGMGLEVEWQPDILLDADEHGGRLWL